MQSTSVCSIYTCKPFVILFMIILKCFSDPHVSISSTILEKIGKDIDVFSMTISSGTIVILLISISINSWSDRLCQLALALKNPYDAMSYSHTKFPQCLPAGSGITYVSRSALPDSWNAVFTSIFVSLNFTNVAIDDKIQKPCKWIHCTVRSYYIFGNIVFAWGVIGSLSCTDLSPSILSLYRTWV